MNAAVPALNDFLGTWLPRLPQASRIREADARRWYEGVLASDPARFEWHFHRLSGFGGSDVGELGAWQLGVPALFNTPEQVVAEKLLRQMIEPPNKYTRRGSLFEDDTRAIFLEDYRARSRTDLIDALRQARSTTHPWARANPDDVVEMRSGGKTKLYLVDYKAASHVKDQAPAQYACQTHHYDFLLWCAEHDGAPRLTGDTPLAVDGLLIVYYDFEKAEAVPVEVPWDGAVLRAVLAGGDQAWDHVLGRREMDFSPNVDAKPAETLRPEEQARVADLEREMVALKLLADQLYARYKDQTAEVERILDDAGRRSKSNTHAGLSRFSLYFRSTVNEEQLVRLCHTAGVDLDSLRADTKTLDASAMAAKLEALGEAPIYQREYDVAKVRGLCAARGYRLPVEESGVFSLSRARAAREALEPLRERAKVEASRATDALLAPAERPATVPAVVAAAAPPVRGVGAGIPSLSLAGSKPRP